VVIIHKGKIAGDGTVESLATAAGHGPWVELAVGGANEQAEAAIAAIPAVKDVRRLEPRDGVVRFRVHGAREVAPELAALASRQGWRVETVAWHAASLEEVFLSLVGIES
jgi:ABC-type multidrug transport system ATPase subunit